METVFLFLACVMCALSANPEFKKARECYVSVGHNIDYLGSVDRTERGQECVHWKYTTWQASDFDRTMNNNFCRNPDKDPRGPWCIVKSGRRQYCSIPKCASSASFDGNGNIEHELYDIAGSTRDSISFDFYTEKKWQNDATILSIKSWMAGELNIKLHSNFDSEVQDVMKLDWSFERNSPPITLTSRPNIAATGGIIRVNITRVERQLTMAVNEEEYTATITKRVSSDAIFNEPGNIFIGRSPYGTNGFRGCIADFSFNNIRTLDIAMGARRKTQDETISISRGVWEGCLLVAPSDWVPDPVSPTAAPDPVIADGQVAVEMTIAETEESAQSRSPNKTPQLPLICSLLLIALVFQ